MSITPTPVVPTLKAGLVSASADWNALNSAAQFAFAKPVCVGTFAAAQALTGSATLTTVSALTISAVAVDTDTIRSGSTLAVQRYGVYAIEYELVAPAAAVELFAAVYLIAGSNNPGASAGSPIYGPNTWKWWYADDQVQGANPIGISAGGLLPVALYPGDQIVYKAAVGTTSTLTSGNFMVRWVGGY